MNAEEFSIKYYNAIKSRQVQWLWYPYIPYGKITILQGDPGDGKTTFILSLIAAMSVGGKLPMSNTHINGVSIYQNAEDDNADTIKPRLEKHNANCDNICFVEKNEGLLLLDDKELESAVAASKAKILVLDSIQAYIGENVDMNRANSIRPRLNKLKNVAERTGCAIVLVGHMNKSSGSNANYRGLGSIDISAAARSVLVVGKVRSTPNVRVLAQLKNNLAPIGKSLAFQLVNGAVDWIGECELSAAELISGNTTKDIPKTMTAYSLLTSLLEDGMKPSNYIFKEAERNGISKRTIASVKAKMPIKSVKKPDGWYWEIQR